jgi:hypothetical protein
MGQVVRGKNIGKEGGTGRKRESTSLGSNEGRAVGLGESDGGN